MASRLLLLQAIKPVQADPELLAGLGPDLVRHCLRVKQAKVRRFDEAKDKAQFQRSEYFGRL